MHGKCQAGGGGGADVDDVAPTPTEPFPHGGCELGGNRTPVAGENNEGIGVKGLGIGGVRNDE